MDHKFVGSNIHCAIVQTGVSVHVHVTNLHHGDIAGPDTGGAWQQMMISWDPIVSIQEESRASRAGADYRPAPETRAAQLRLRFRRKPSAASWTMP
jgi:hypothetical protein